MQPDANERCARIALAHLRGLQALLAISFIDSTANLGDVGPKRAGSLSLLQDFLSTCRFILSFTGRKKRDGKWANVD